MTDIVIRATQESELEKGLLEALPGWKNKFIYDEHRKNPVLHKKLIKSDAITTVSNKTYGSQIVFDIPRYGSLYKSFLKVQVRGTAAMTSTHDPRFGASFFSQVMVTSNSKIIQTQTSTGCLSKINDAEIERMNSYLYATEPTPALGDGVVSTFYVPMFCWYNNESSMLDTLSHDKLQVVATINNKESLFKTGDTFGFTVESVELKCLYLQFDNDVWSHIKQGNYGSDGNLTIKASDQEAERQQRQTYSSGSFMTFQNVELRSKSLVHSISVRARNLNSGVSLPINGIQLTSNGQELYSRDTRENFLIEDDKLFGNVSSSGTNTIHFGMSKDSSWASGEVSFYELTPLLTVEVDTSAGVGSGDVVTLDIVVHYHSVISLNSDTRVIQKTLSN